MSVPAQRTTSRGGGRGPRAWAAGGPRMVRVTFSAVLLIRAGGARVLFEQRAERGVFGPVGDVLRGHPPASDVLRGLGFRGQRWAGWGPGPLAELDGEVPARSLAELRRWFDSGAYREDAAECLRRALASTLTGLGAADLAEDVASARFAPLGVEVLGPEPVPGSPHRRLRHREHHELVCVDARAHRLRDRLLELAADPDVREVLAATEEQIARGRAGAALVAAHAAVAWEAVGAGAGAVGTAEVGTAEVGTAEVAAGAAGWSAFRDVGWASTVGADPGSGVRAAIRGANSGDSAGTGVDRGAESPGAGRARSARPVPQAGAGAGMTADSATGPISGADLELGGARALPDRPFSALATPLIEPISPEVPPVPAATSAAFALEADSAGRQVGSGEAGGRQAASRKATSGQAAMASGQVASRQAGGKQVASGQVASRQAASAQAAGRQAAMASGQVAGGRAGRRQAASGPASAVPRSPGGACAGCARYPASTASAASTPSTASAASTPSTASTASTASAECAECAASAASATSATSAGCAP
ncbi:SMODS-associated NUDIX domain-containing protein [Actinosynnema pretiosum]|uniref:SMODS-associated NUDIX domain-containing protein n=1 Tax=Actinosynnema pretiosum TaxID=42197 RepID=UPI0012FE7834|nr:hypothetical protein [Actinosynnema pretiosum]